MQVDVDVAGMATNDLRDLDDSDFCLELPVKVKGTDNVREVRRWKGRFCGVKMHQGGV